MIKASTFALYLVSVYQEIKDPTMGTINNFGSNIIWFSLCYIALEIRAVKIVLDTKNLN
jgi:hypothetical protein